MSKTKTPVASVALDHPDAPKLAAALAAVRGQAPAAGAQKDMEVFELGQAVGAIHMARLQQSFSAAAEIRLFEEIRTANKFKDLPLPRPDGSYAAAESFEEFCRLTFGVGYNVMQERRQDLAALGEAAYDIASRLGLNRKQMRLIRALPSPQQEQVRIALEGGTKAEVVAVIEDLAADLVQAKEQVEELHAEAKATGEVLTKKNQRIDKLEAEKRRFAKLPPDEALKHMLAEANGVMLEARASIQGQLRMAIKTIQDHCEQHGGDRKAQDVVLAGLVGELTKALTGVRDEFWLPDVSNAADLKLMSEVAQWSKP